MEVILLERIERLGQMGDVVTVKPGYARNFLLPQKKALRATEANRTRFESERVQLEAQNLERKSEADSIGTKLDGVSVVLIRAASDSGQLYGSVTARDIAISLGEAGYTVSRNQVLMERPVKTLGVFDFRIRLHPEVTATVSVNVAKSDEEAAVQADRVARGLPALQTLAEQEAEHKRERRGDHNGLIRSPAEVLDEDGGAIRPGRKERTVADGELSVVPGEQIQAEHGDAPPHRQGELVGEEVSDDMRYDDGDADRD